MLITEKDIELYLKSRAEHFGGRCLKLPAVYEDGIPDRLVILPGGLMAFAEVKRPQGGKISKIQEYQIDKLRSLGCIAEVVKNYNEVDALLVKMMNNGKTL